LFEGDRDLSSAVYTYHDAPNDLALKSFALTKEATDTITVIKDIMAVNPILQVHLVPWSPVSKSFLLVELGTDQDISLRL
jgi:hypothetical protein